MLFLLFFVSDFEQIFTCKEVNNIIKLLIFTNVNMHLVFHKSFRIIGNKNLTFNIIIHVFEFTLSIFFCFAILFVCNSNIRLFHILLKNYLLLFYVIYIFSCQSCLEAAIKRISAKWILPLSDNCNFFCSKLLVQTLGNISVGA